MPNRHRDVNHYATVCGGIGANGCIEASCSLEALLSDVECKLSTITVLNQALVSNLNVAADCNTVSNAQDLFLPPKLSGRRQLLY